ncbi:hypothetical protein GCM10029963_24550 [Micromonospora andamanensis]
MSSEDRFRRIYADNFEALLAYASRRVEQPDDAADVVAETFLVAWRRSAHLPGDDEIRLWLYGVARRVLANHHRSVNRRERLGERLRQCLTAVYPPDPGSEVPQRLAVRAALRRLNDADRELLLLTVWEGLQPREAAQVVGVSPAAPGPACRERGPGCANSSVTTLTHPDMYSMSWPYPSRRRADDRRAPRPPGSRRRPLST